jgi:hypothetical protein
MPHTPSKGDGQISRVHSMALLEEIGERLRSDMDLDRTEPPLHLLQLMKRFERAAY